MARRPPAPEQAPLGSTPTLPAPQRDLPPPARALMERLVTAQRAGLADAGQTVADAADRSAPDEARAADPLAAPVGWEPEEPLDVPPPHSGPLMSAVQADLDARIARRQLRLEQRRAQRDYSLAIAMVGADPAPQVDLAAAADEPLAVSQPSAPAGFVRAGVVATGGLDEQLGALLQRGVSAAHLGHDPQGAALFELQLDPELLQGARCSLRLHEGRVQVCFRVSDEAERERLAERLPQLREQLERRGLRIDELVVVGPEP